MNDEQLCTCGHDIGEHYVDDDEGMTLYRCWGEGRCPAGCELYVAAEAPKEKDT